jgi:predicted 3-demethylubiquinone-9 3-methyltransferase (glyoxalase superfamily)
MAEMRSNSTGSPSLTPHLWFDKEAVEAAEFYTALFPNSAIDHVVRLRDTPSGECELVCFELSGTTFLAISAGPAFRFNPSISFLVNFDPVRDSAAQARLEATWARLAEGGTVLMPLDAYPFSRRFGWIQDRFGLSWQLILSNPAGDPRPFLMPALLFTDEIHGRAEEAGAFYRSVFADSQPGRILRHPPETGPGLAATVAYSDFRLGDTWFAAIDGGHGHGFRFNEAVSFVVNCRDQAEIDHFWEKLSAVPEAEACGWLKDRFGVSWQIQPAELHAMIRCGDQACVDRLMRALLAMKKPDLAALRAAGQESAGG